MKTFGQQLYALRRHLSLSQRQLAARVGTSGGHISLVERGEVTPRLRTQEKWAEAISDNPFGPRLRPVEDRT